MRTRRTWHIFIIILLFSVVLIVVACSKYSNHRSLRREMMDIQSVTNDLFTLAWSPNDFKKDNNHLYILELISEIGEGFHRVDMFATEESFEPGFRTVLTSQRAMIAEIEQKFASGDKQYANKRLRALANNCIACHSRHKANENFFGKVPVAATRSVEDRFARAEFLFATKQFSKASNALMEIANSSEPGAFLSSYSFKALKLWLVIQVRVNYTPKRAANELTAFASSAQLSPYYKQTIEHWINDLNDLSSQHPPAHGLLVEAKHLLDPHLREQTTQADEADLAKTLRATAVLHNYLRGLTPLEQRREATFLLAVAYNHMPIDSFNTLQQLLLETVIEEFPGSEEAAEAFEMYRSYAELVYGSANNQILFDTSAAKRRFKHLRALAQEKDDDDELR